MIKAKELPASYTIAFKSLFVGIFGFIIFFGLLKRPFHNSAELAAGMTVGTAIGEFLFPFISHQLGRR